MTLSDCKRKLLDPRVIFAVWTLLSVISILTRATRGQGRFNNFMIFRGVADHLFQSLPLYGVYPGEYLDMNHYGPVFGLLVAPFAVIPPWLGAIVWSVGLSLLLYWAVRKLPLTVQAGSLVLWLSLNDLCNAVLMQQFNIASAAMIVGSLALILKRREGWAALLIVLGTFVKIYGIVGLAFFFFVQRKWRFIGYMALWSVVALLAPLLVVSPEYLAEQYITWFTDLTAKSAQNMWSIPQNISLVGAVRKISGSGSYSDLLVIVPGMVLFLLSYLRIGQYRHTGFRLTILASLLLFVVLFSNGSENSGYVIAAVGAGIWWVTLQRRGWLEWTLLVLMLIASFAYNLFPMRIYDFILQYALRAIPYALIWLHCIWRLWTEDFSRTTAGITGQQPADR